MHLSSKKIEDIFIYIDTIPDARKAILQVRAAGMNLPTLHFSGFPPMVVKYEFLNHAEKKSEFLSDAKFHSE